MGFDKNNFLNLMKDNELHLPRRWSNGDFQKELRNLYNYYIEKLASVVIKDDLKLIKRICNLVLLSVEHYYNGYTSNSFRTFKSVMEELMRRPFMIYQKSGDIITVMDIDDLRLYRVRNVNENRVYTRKDIFHTPFLLRSKIGTFRYSIAGYPCLYLATNLDLCILETPKTSNTQMTLAARFQIVRNNYENDYHNIKVIELGVKPQHFLGPTQEDLFTYDNERTINRLYEIDLTDIKVMRDYLLWYPVIAASSFIRICKSDPFASEYIVPQLIMEWVRLSAKNNEYYGIRYFSCANERASEIGMNYVFPTYYDKTSTTNYCSVLSKVFKLTEPVMVHNYLGEHDCQRGLDNFEVSSLFT